jgi:Ca2+-transporting ATPase
MPPASPNIPAIVTTDLSSKLSLVNDPPPSPPPPDLLSPSLPSSSARRSYFDLPRSPSPSLTFVSSNDAASVLPPPSPTLSTQSSVHFATSLTLRDNRPDERSGASSLQLLSPSAIDRTAHRRKGSFTSSHDGHSSIAETEADHNAGVFNLSAIRRPISNATSLTLASHTHLDPDPSKPFGRRVPDDNIILPSTQTQLDTQARVPNPPALQDSPPDLGPFSFEPNQLASLLDPKDLDALQALGGITSILDGLGTHPTRGLLLDHGAGRPPHATLGAREGASQRHDSHPRKSLPHAPDDPHPHSSLKAGDNDMRKAPDPHTASLADRKAVYGENILPQRPTTSLLGLMWHALKDKVLVRQYSPFGPPFPLYSLGLIIHSCCSIIGARPVPGFRDDASCWPAACRLGRGCCHHDCNSYCRRSFPGFVCLPSSPKSQVIVGSLNDWQKERQFEVLNQKKDERSVKVIRNGEEHLIDIKVRPPHG